MKRVASIVDSHQDQQVRFKDLGDEQKSYHLNRDFFDHRPKYAHRFTYEWRDFFKNIRTNYPDTYFIINTGGNQVTDIQHVLAPFRSLKYIAQSGISDNYGLAIEKAGHFKKDRMDYMDLQGKQPLHKYSNDVNLIKMLQNKQEAIMQSYAQKGYKVSKITMTQTWRLAMGLGGASAYNNGFTLHKTYGIPYLPAQSIKGVVRSHIISEIYDIAERDEITNGKSSAEDSVEIEYAKDHTKREDFALTDPGFCTIFGNGDKTYDGKTRKGKVIFLDAFPSGHFTMEPDIMNPHYPEYYQQEIKKEMRTSDLVPPGDWQSPVPIIFLTVKGATFDLIFAVKGDSDEKLPSHKNYINSAGDEKIAPIANELQDRRPSEILEQYLPQSMQYHGIGAKTAVGYGRLKISGNKNSPK